MIAQSDLPRNDILRKHGVIPEKPPSPTPQIEAALERTAELAHANRLESHDLDELAALEDEEDEDFLAHYRNKRMQELSELQAAGRYGHVFPLQKPEYEAAVTDESHKAWVFVLLTSSEGLNTESRILEELWRTAAERFKEVKFASMSAGLCIEGYPDRNTPTVLIYKDGDIKRQIVTLRELGGKKTDMRAFEAVLKDVGAIKPGDSRLETRNTPDEQRRLRDEDDDDSDD